VKWLGEQHEQCNKYTTSTKDISFEALKFLV